MELNTINQWLPLAAITLNGIAIIALSVAVARINRRPSVHPFEFYNEQDETRERYNRLKESIDRLEGKAADREQAKLLADWINNFWK